MCFIPDVLSSTVMAVVVIIIKVVVVIVTSSTGVRRFTAWSHLTTVTSFSTVSSVSAAIPVHGFRSRFARKWSYGIVLFSANLSPVFSVFFPASISGLQSTSSPVLGF